MMEDIKKILWNFGINDIYFMDNCPTWPNGRRGGDFIGKMLDRFIISSSLRLQMEKMKANVVDPTVSDHRTITL